MANRSSVHEWINSIVAVLALLVSGYFAWQSNRAKTEALSMTVRPTAACRTEYQGDDKFGEIGLCWEVILANDSEDRLSIVGYRISNIVDGKRVSLLGFQNLESADGRPLPLPISLDGGEAKQIIVRSGVTVPAAVAEAIAQLPQYKTHSLASLPLIAVQRDLAAEKLDFIGNKVEPLVTGRQLKGWSFPPHFKTSVSVLTVTTGRGAPFSATMTYPPGPQGAIPIFVVSD
jgi:hypothetical protein